MVARRSWLHTQQSLCSLLPCRRLPDRIQEALYRREMKTSVSYRSCSVSCGTSMFGLLWGRSLRVWVPACHSAPFPTVVKLPSRGGIGALLSNQRSILARVGKTYNTSLQICTCRSQSSRRKPHSFLTLGRNSCGGCLARNILGSSRREAGPP